MSFKCVLVGDAAVGKYRLIEALTTGKFSSGFDAPYMEEVRHTLTVGRRKSVLNIVKTPGNESYDSVRSLFFADADVFVICFALNNPTSLKNVTEKWQAEVMRHSSETPIILVGTKLDLRVDSPEEETFTRTDGQTLALKMQAAEYLECSALTGEGVVAVFEKALKAASRHLNKVRRYSAMGTVCDSD